MKGLEKMARMSQISVRIKDTQSKPTLPGVGCIEGRPTSSSSRHPVLSLTGKGTVDDWIQEVPDRSSDIHVGVIKELISLDRRYIHEVRFAIIDHEEAAMDPEVLELGKRLSLWADGEGDLDRKLAEYPEVREVLVSSLTALVLVFSTGMDFFRPKYKQRLVDDTDRLVEQASKLTSCRPDRPTSYPPTNILEFINTTNSTIKSKTDTLYDLLPTIQHLIENFDEIGEQQSGEITSNKRKSSYLDVLRTKLNRNMERWRSRIPRPSGGAVSDHRLHPDPSNVSKDQSHSSSNSRSIASLFSRSDTRSSVDPLTATVTSTSPSEIDKSTNKPKVPSLNRASSSYSKCKTTSVDAAVLDGCVSHSKVPGTEPIKNIYPRQNVKLWHRDGRSYGVYTVLLDTGSDESFICSSVVKEQDLVARSFFPMPVKLLADRAIEVNELVNPTWQFQKIGSIRHDNFGFRVVSAIPENLDMVMGNKVLLELGLSLSSSGSAFVAQADSEERSILKKQQQKGERQARDASSSDAKWQQFLKAQNAEVMKEKAAANAAIRDRTPQKAVTWSGGEQQR